MLLPVCLIAGLNGIWVMLHNFSSSLFLERKGIFPTSINISHQYESQWYDTWKHSFYVQPYVNYLERKGKKSKMYFQTHLEKWECATKKRVVQTGCRKQFLNHFCFSVLKYVDQNCQQLYSMPHLKFCYFSEQLLGNI